MKHVGKENMNGIATILSLKVNPLQMACTGGRSRNVICSPSIACMANETPHLSYTIVAGDEYCLWWGVGI